MKKYVFLFLFFIVVMLESISANTLINFKTSDSLNYYYQLAIKPSQTDDFTKAYDYFIKHKTECLDANNYKGAIYDLRLLSIIQTESGFFSDAESSAIEGIALLKDIDDKDYIKSSQIGFYNQIGRIRKALKDYDASIQYYNTSLDLTTNSVEKASILNNKALVYRDQNKLDKAYNLFLLVHETALESKDTTKIATALDNLGYVAFKLNKPKALAYMEEALAMRLKTNVNYKTFPSYVHLSDYYLAQDDSLKAKEFLIKAKEVAVSLNSESYKLEALRKLIALDTASYGNAYVSLNEEKQNRQLRLENKYAARKYNYKVQEDLALQSKRKKEIAQIILVAVSIIGLLTLYLFRLRHKKETLNEVYNTEFKLSKRLHDEVANDVYQAMAQIQSNQDKDAVVDFLDQIYLKTRNISKENDIIKEEDNFSELITELISSYKNTDVNIFTKGIAAIDWQEVELLKRITIYRAVQELLTNMKKHSKAKLVALVFEKKGRKTQIKYTDDGVGTAITAVNKPRSTENRIKAIGGKITFETSPGNGFKVNLEI